MGVIYNCRPHYSATATRRVFYRGRFCASTVHLIDHAIVPRKKKERNTHGWKIDVAYDRSSSTRHRFSSRAFGPGNRGKEEKTKNLTLRGLKADQFRVFALAGAVKGSHPGVIERVEVQPIHGADSLTAAIYLLRIRFQT